MLQDRGARRGRERPTRRGQRRERALLQATRNESRLSHPGDDSPTTSSVQRLQALQSMKVFDGCGLDGLDVRFVVASGASQSAARLATVYNALHPAGVIDAYHLPVYFGSGSVVDSTIGEEGLPGGSPNWAMRMLPRGMHGLRQDLGVPVFVLNSESEAQVFTSNQQPDSKSLVIWESAGASHIGGVAGDRFGLPDTRCRGSFAPAQRAVWHHMRRWLEQDVTPPSQPRLERALRRVGRPR